MSDAFLSLLCTHCAPTLSGVKPACIFTLHKENIPGWQTELSSCRSLFSGNGLRLRSAKAGGFPHEIGLFLGYPLEDVTGFIAAGGAEYRCSGCWKVYGDVEQAQHLFRRYAACRKRYLAMASSGLTLGEMLAAG